MEPKIIGRDEITDEMTLVGRVHDMETAIDHQGIGRWDGEASCAIESLKTKIIWRAEKEFGREELVYLVGIKYEEELVPSGCIYSHTANVYRISEDTHQDPRFVLYEQELPDGAELLGPVEVSDGHPIEPDILPHEQARIDMEDFLNAEILSSAAKQYQVEGNQKLFLIADKSRIEDHVAGVHGRMEAKVYQGSWENKL